MEDLYFERNESMVRRAKQTLKNLFLFTGAENVSNYDLIRCLNELGKFCEYVEKNRVTKNEILNIENPVTNIINKAIHIAQKVQSIDKKELEPIDSFFEAYKKDNGVVDVDFGLGGYYKKRKKECVYNKAMFARVATSKGYPQREISRMLKIERSVVCHYLYYYKTPNFVHEKQHSKTMR